MSKWNNAHRNSAMKDLEAMAEWSRANWWKTGNKKRRTGLSASLHLGGKKAKKDEKDVDKTRIL